VSHAFYTSFRQKQTLTENMRHKSQRQHNLHTLSSLTLSLFRKDRNKPKQNLVAVELQMTVLPNRKTFLRVKSLPDSRRDLKEFFEFYHWSPLNHSAFLDFVS